MGFIGNGSGGLPGMGMGGGGAFGFLSGGNTPQDRGFGIQNPADFVGYDTGGGMQMGDTSGMGSLDISGPGAAENFFGAFGGQYGAPSQSEAYWNQNAGQYGKAGLGETYAQGALGRYGGGNNPHGSNNSQEAYSFYKGDRPDFNHDPGLTPYYNHAEQLTSDRINREMASRGGFNSSAALDQLNNASQGLRAEQANREGDYHLRQLAEQRAWDQLGGQLAGGADQNSLANSQNELGWLGGLGSLANSAQGNMLNRLNAGGMMAGNADQAMLNRLNGGMNAANIAQQDQMSRAQQLFGDQMGLGGALAGMAGDAYNGMFQQDQSLMDASMAGEMGLAGEALNQDYRTQQRIKDDAAWAEDMMSGGGSGGKGGGGGGMLGGLLGGII